MFNPNERQYLPDDDLEARLSLRMVFEGRATQKQAQQARAFLLNLTDFYSHEFSERPPEATLEARRIMATIIEYTRLDESQLSAQELPSEEPYQTDG